MTLPNIFDLCKPRDDVAKGTISDSDYAANLANVLTGCASRDYTDAPTFFTNTYPTEGLKELLVNVCGRLSGRGESISAVFRLDTSFGGGKTHGLIALVHAAAGMKGVSNIAEFLDPAIVPARSVRVAAFDGENADPANGRPMGEGIRAHTPWEKLRISSLERPATKLSAAQTSKELLQAPTPLRSYLAQTPCSSSSTNSVNFFDACKTWVVATSSRGF